MTIKHSSMYPFEQATFDKLIANSTLNANNIEEIENALCDIDAADEERMAEIEDALCELDKGE